MINEKKGKEIKERLEVEHISHSMLLLESVLLLPIQMFCQLLKTHGAQSLMHNYVVTRLLSAVWCSRKLHAIELEIQRITGISTKMT